MVLKIREGMQAATIIRQMAETAKKISKEKGEEVIAGTMGQPVGKTDAQLVCMNFLSALSYLDENEESLIKNPRGLFAYLRENEPEALLVLEQYGMKLDGKGKNIQYTAPAGKPELREKAAEELKQHFYPEIAEHISKDNIFFSSGGTTGLTACFAALEGDYFTGQGYFALYNNQATAFQKKINSINLEDENFNFTADALRKGLQAHCAEKNIDPKELEGNLIYCYPGNPITTSPSEEEMKKIADVLRHEFPKMNIIIDEPYANFQFKLDKFDSKKHQEGKMNDEDWWNLCDNRKTFIQIAPDLFKDRAVIVKTLGKDISGTGARLGAVICGGEFEALAGSHFNLAHTPPENMQPLIPFALSYIHTKEHKIGLAKKYIPRLHALFNELNKEGILVGGNNVVGGMFNVADMKNMLGLKLTDQKEINTICAFDNNFDGTIKNATHIALLLMERHLVSPVPGEFFALTSGMSRIAVSQENVEDTITLGQKFAQASREAAVEHITNSLINKTGIIFKEDHVLIPKGNIHDHHVENLSGLKGVKFHSNGDRNYKIEFNSNKTVETFKNKLQGFSLSPR